MKEEKIALLAGSFELLGRLSYDTTALMEFTLADGRRYMLRFTDHSGNSVVVSYPADIQLISGMLLMEREDWLAEAIWLTKIPPEDSSEITSDLLEQIGGSALYLRKGNTYLLPEMNSNRYYVRDSDGTFSLLYSEDFPCETMANLMSTASMPSRIKLHIKLVKYGYRVEEFTVPLQQWVAFCMAEGCQPYFGVISRRDDEVVCEVLMHNEGLGYAHLAKIAFNPMGLGEPDYTMIVRMNSYIPLSNVKNIFGELE